MGKWLNGARVRKREIDGKDTRIAALVAAEVVTAMEHQPPGSAGMEAIYGVRAEAEHE